MSRAGGINPIPELRTAAKTAKGRQECAWMLLIPIVSGGGTPGVVRKLKGRPHEQRTPSLHFGGTSPALLRGHCSATWDDASKVERPQRATTPCHDGAIGHQQDPFGTDACCHQEGRGSALGV